jgi:hypothetical protein
MTSGMGSLEQVATWGISYRGLQGRVFLLLELSSRTKSRVSSFKVACHGVLWIKLAFPLCSLFLLLTEEFLPSTTHSVLEDAVERLMHPSLVNVAKYLSGHRPRSPVAIRPTLPAPHGMGPLPPD